MDETYSIQFKGDKYINIVLEGKTTLSELIEIYFKRIGKSNLLVNNIENMYENQCL